MIMGSPPTNSTLGESPRVERDPVGSNLSQLWMKSVRDGGALEWWSLRLNNLRKGAGSLTLPALRLTITRIECPDFHQFCAMRFKDKGSPQSLRNESEFVPRPALLRW